MQQTAPAHDINLAALAPMGDALFAELNQLREADPIYWSKTSHCWIVTGHTETTEAFAGQLPLSSAAMPGRLYGALSPEQFHARYPNVVRYFPLSITNMDGEAHARLRKLFVKAFSRKFVEDLRPFVRDRIRVLLDSAAERGELEFHEEIARMLRGAVILRLLGMSPDYLKRLKGWADAVTTALMSFDPKPEWMDRLEVATADMVAVFRSEIEARKAAPQADLITQLLNAVEDGSSLSMDEMLAALLLAIIAGHESTSNSLTLGIRALAAHPQAWAYWRAHPDKGVDSAVELMRYSAMSAAQARIVAKDFEWRGHQLHRGDFVMLMMAGGNRDPRAYSEPEKLDLTRSNDMSLTFGPGLHHCIGHLLAKLQLSEFFGALVERFDRIEILKEPQFTHAVVFRAVTALQVRFYPRRGS